MQATISAFRLIKNMSINPKSVEFHQCHANPHSICLFITISKITKEIFAKICWQSKHRLGLESARAALCKWATCMRQTFLSKTFAKSLNVQKQYEKTVWEKSNDAYSLSIRVQNMINHISILTFLCFLWQYQHQRKCFLSERELKKALRDTLTPAAWLGPSNFWLVPSEYAHASYPGLFFHPPGLSTYMGREERRVQGLDYWWLSSLSFTVCAFFLVIYFFLELLTSSTWALCFPRWFSWSIVCK